MASKALCGTICAAAWLALGNPCAAGAEPPPRTVHDVLAALDSRPINAGKLAAARQVLEAPKRYIVR